MGKANRLIIVFHLILIYMVLCVTGINAADYENYYVNEYHEIAEETVPPDKVTLNADRVSFNDETGEAFAEGNAILTYKDTTIMAERIEYDADTQKVQAMPFPNQQVVITDGERVIKGDNLTYDLNTQEGILTGARSVVPVGENDGVLYVYGEDINVMPWELAKEMLSLSVDVL